MNSNEASSTPAILHPPKDDEYFEYYGTYIRLVPEGNVIEHATAQVKELGDFFGRVPESEAMLLHPPYTWTSKQVCGHMIDTERVFADRLHRFACGQFQPLEGMDQDAYVSFQDFESPSLQSLAEELMLCRQSNVLMLRRLKQSAWDQRGMASGHEITVRALAYALVGHVSHHLNILKRRFS